MLRFKAIVLNDRSSIILLYQHLIHLQICLIVEHLKLCKNKGNVLPASLERRQIRSQI